jgi:hypothetical protein
MLTSLLAGILANHSAQQENDKEQTTQGTCGHTYEPQLTLFSQDTASSKTSKDTYRLDYEKSSQTYDHSDTEWKTIVANQRGEYSVRKKLAHHTEEKGCLSWRSPSHQEAGARVETLFTKDGAPAQPGQRAYRKQPDGRMVLQTQTINQQVLMNWPTAASRDHKDTPGMSKERNGKPLGRIDQLPRAVYHYGQQDQGNHSTNGNRLALQEEWRQIPGFGEKYQVSNLGRVRSKAHRRWKLMNLPIKSTGYPQASFRHQGKQKKVTVHILVALLFIGPRPKGLVINHKDGDKLNNIPENLEYVTVAENNRHAQRTLLNSTKGESNPRSVLTESQVVDVKERLQYQSQKEIAEMYGVHRGTIQAIASGRNWNHLNRVQESWATPNTMDNLPPRSPEGVKKQATGARAGRAKPANLREQVDPMSCEIYQNPDVFPTGSSTSGKLNPRWVETLMGLPIGWTMPSCTNPVIIAPTNSGCLETESCRQQQKSHGELSTQDFL